MIRPASRDDARALAELEVRAWRWAYTDVVDEADMPAVDEREERRRTEPLDGTFVWEHGGRIAGVVEIDDAARDGEPHVGHLRGLYVDPPAQGAGLGTLLHDHAVARLREAGFTEATLWLFTADGHAREFLAARGWRPDGERGEWLGVPQLRYRRGL